jgi:hypothetical protein
MPAARAGFFAFGWIEPETKAPALQFCSGAISVALSAVLTPR